MMRRTGSSNSVLARKRSSSALLDDASVAAPAPETSTQGLHNSWFHSPRASSFSSSNKRQVTTLDWVHSQLMNMQELFTAGSRRRGASRARDDDDHDSYYSMQLLLQFASEMKSQPLVFLDYLLDLLAASETPTRTTNTNTNPRTNDVTLKVYCTASLQCLTCQLKPQEKRPAMQVLLAAMHRHARSISVQLECCKNLQIIMQQDPSLVTHPKTCLNILLQTMQLYRHDPVVLHLAIDLVRRLQSVLSSPLDWLQAVNILMETLWMHSSHAPLQQVGLSLLATLTEQDACRALILQKGGVDLLIYVMQKHASDCLINCNAAAALCWLVHAGSSGVTATATATTTTTDTSILHYEQHVPTLVACLVIHLDNASVFGNCVCVLCGLANDALQDQEAHVLALIRRGMHMHMENAKVQESCLRWIRFRRTHLCREQLILTIPTILEGMRVHKKNADLQTQAVDVLCILSDAHPTLCQALTDHGATDIVLGVLKEHRQDEGIKQGALLFMSLLLPRDDEDPDHHEQHDEVAAGHEVVHPFGGDFSTIETIWSGLGMELRLDE